MRYMVLVLLLAACSGGGSGEDSEQSAGKAQHLPALLGLDNGLWWTYYPAVDYYPDASPRYFIDERGVKETYPGDYLAARGGAIANPSEEITVLPKSQYLTALYRNSDPLMFHPAYEKVQTYTGGGLWDRADWLAVYFP